MEQVLAARELPHRLPLVDDPEAHGALVRRRRRAVPPVRERREERDGGGVEAVLGLLGLALPLQGLCAVVPRPGAAKVEEAQAEEDDDEEEAAGDGCRQRAEQRGCAAARGHGLSGLERRDV